MKIVAATSSATDVVKTAKKKGPKLIKTNRFPTAIKNIIAIYEQASQEEIEGGLSWYQDANDFAQKQASIYGLRIEVVAGIISSLSPATDWERNKADAIQLLQGNKDHKFGTYGTNVTKAWDILAVNDGDTVERYFPADKTFNFYHNIINPNGKSHVTIDRHALSVALGFCREDKTVSRVEYRELADAYRKAAKKLGVLPLQVQSLTWVVWRSAKGYKSKFTLADLKAQRTCLVFN